MITLLKHYFVSMCMLVISLITSELTAHHKKLSHFRYNAASVLINTNIKQKGDKSTGFILLGREAGGHDRGTWDDFGGSRDKNEHDSLYTAAREAHEETVAQQTLGWTIAHMQDYISLKKTNTSHVLAVTGIKKKANYVVYVTQFPFLLIKKLCTRFFLAQEWVTSWKNKEKDGLALVKWHDLMTAIKNKKNIVQALVFNRKKNKFSRTQKTITLRPVLCKKLKNFAHGLRFVQGADRRVRFYVYHSK